VQFVVFVPETLIEEVKARIEPLLPEKTKVIGVNRPLLTDN
jgi:hypothetical protein